MVYFQFEGEKIPFGNFAFLSDVTGNEEVARKFFNAEKNLKVDYIDFAHKMRKALEAFALEEGSKFGKIHKQEYSNLDIEQIKEDLIGKIKGFELKYSEIVTDICEGKENDFKNMLVKYSFLKSYAGEIETKIKFGGFIRFLYSFGSMSSHENVHLEEKYETNKENCIRVAGAFHDFLCIYYGIDKKYDSTLIPIRDYIAVPKHIVEKIGMTLEVGKSLFVKEDKGKIGFYIFSSDIDSISVGQRRDIDTISKLWDDNIEDPLNVIRKVDSVSGSNGDYRFQVYSLPGRPLRLTVEFVNALSSKDKMDIIAGLCRGVQSLHNYDPPMFHRNINPDAFYIFNIKGKYKPLLAKFDCAKDTDNAAFTVYNNVEKKATNKNTNAFFAPEVLASQMGVGVDWKKADIFSLAKTILYILSGKNLSITEVMEYENEIDDEILLMLMEMIDDNPDKRPELSDLRALLNKY